MSKERKMLLWSIICVIGYLLLEYFVLSKIDLSKFLGVNQQETQTDIISNVISYLIYFSGIIYFSILIFNKKIDLNIHLKGILIWSIIFFILNIVSGVLGFIVYSNLSKKKKNKRQLPIIEYKEYTNKYICLIVFIICMLIMFVFSNYINKFWQLILMYLFMFVLLIITFRKQLLHDFKIFKEYFKEYFSLTFITWIKSLVVMMIIQITIFILTNTNQSVNQQSLNEMFKVYPIFVGLLAVIYAPITEELLFRGVIRKFIKNKYLFIIISGVLFGLLHVIDDSKTLSEFLFVITYSSLGMFLASLYYKTNNICTNILFHFLQNSLGVLGMILTYYFL